MKQIYLILIFFLVAGNFVSAQEEKVEAFKPSGKATGKVYWNYNLNLTEGVDARNAFELKRTYLGYKYNFSEKVSAKIVLDGSKESEASDFTVFAKNAQLDWELSDKVMLSGGLIGAKQFDTQEKFWGYRYIFKSLQDEYGFGSSADLGINGEFSFNDFIKVNLFVLNGEGYSHMQDASGSLKAGGNVIVNPIDGLILKAYYDIYGNDFVIEEDSIIKDTASIGTLSLFTGYESDKFRIGAEYNVQFNGTKYTTVAQDYNLTGIALYGTYIINPKIEIFGQWMNLKLKEPEGNPSNIKYSKEGNLILAGVQYTLTKGVNMALSYKTFLYENPDKVNDSFVFLNFEFSF